MALGMIFAAGFVFIMAGCAIWSYLHDEPEEDQ
jgi:hypothetical protein